MSYEPSPELLAQRAKQEERRLQEALNHPILFILCPDRLVRVVPPWYWETYKNDIHLACRYYDLLFDDDSPQRDVRFGVGPYEDYYCNVGSRETRLLAWEIQAASEIADRWEEFWKNPNQFVKKISNPQNYKWKIVSL